MKSKFCRIIICAALACAASTHQGRAQTPNIPPPPPAKTNEVAKSVPLWTEAERQAVVTYWSAPGRYKIEPAADIGSRVNITVPGSLWWAALNQAMTQQTKETAAAWLAWATARLTRERGEVDDRLANATAPPPTEATGTPADIKAAVSEPPALYESTKPQRYTVAFAPADATLPFVYVDNIDFTRRKPYMPAYRSANGVVQYGKRVKDYTGEEQKARESLFVSVGGTESQRRVLQAVSALEGGFEAVNTYDTGWVSIGFIQFITARNGDGSLAAVLARHKADDPADFAQTFHRFGIDVLPDTILAVVDPQTGQEKRASEAVQTVINDKRLTAVFERAGSRDGFRRAQIRVARERYWPGDDLVSVMPNGNPNAPAPPAPLVCKASDIVKSEAGMATLMDRKVNRGNIRLINQVAADLMRRYNLTRLEDLAEHERELVSAMKYRHDFLSDSTLSQPK